jgi:RIO kinase 1
MDSERKNMHLYDLEELDALPKIKNLSQKEARKVSWKVQGKGRKKGIKLDEQREMQEMLRQDDNKSSMQLTYQAARHEQEWLLGSLGAFYEQQWFSDVLRIVKGGKEASVYQCAASPHLNAAYLAAKVYRPRKFRNLKNDHMYRDGRFDLDSEGNQIINGGMLHAIRKKTEYGLELLHTSWIEYEYKALQTLYEAGADVPKPYASGGNSILMEYIGGDDLAAPTLNTVNLDKGEGRRLFKRTIENIEIMLKNNLVHSDLSAYNILYWDGQIVLIDFPQVVQPGSNRSAYPIFKRDVMRVCEYFQRQGVSSEPGRLASELWKGAGLQTRPEIHPRLLDDQDEADRRFWQQTIDEAAPGEGES